MKLEVKPFRMANLKWSPSKVSQDLSHQVAKSSDSVFDGRWGAGFQCKVELRHGKAGVE